uniref:Interleukin-1 receptor-associated kinase 4 n=1 Tax=Xiphophorus couchianus TaxID=32473 RepID=A0A3B5MWA2_9TELE
MSSSLTSATYIRNISYGLRRQLSDFLDPQDRWKDVIVSIRKPSGEPRYSQLHVRRFEGLVTQGKSPTVELLNDWGTTNCTVGELVDILKSRNLLAAASLLQPCNELLLHITLPLPLPLRPDRDPPTRPLDETQTGGCSDSFDPLAVQLFSGISSFMYSELRKITGNFDDRSVSNGGSRLGEGGFGTVYKGFLNNRPVAVKKLNPMDDMPLDKLQDQFNQEIQTLKVLKHENLVDMVGFSCDEQQMCIVYAFMANGSLLDRLACLDGSPPLSWRQRCLIAEGTARGLEYLHSNHHVHRDVKSANILLDENFVAKISDFGLTRASAKHTSTTMMTERIVGTRAYMAPEALRGQITPKSDVFSFGVVRFGHTHARRKSDFMDIRDDIDDEDEDLTLEQILDREMTDWELSQVESIYCLASNCLDDRKNRRPFIKQVVSEIHSVIKSISLQL